MLILDTDHMSELHRGTAKSMALRDRLTAASQPFCRTIVTVEELWRGRLAQVAGNKSGPQLIVPYERIGKLVEALSHWQILRWTSQAAQVYDRLRALRLGIGTMDLRIASIAITSNATLLSRNLRDFARVPDLKSEDWLS